MFQLKEINLLFKPHQLVDNLFVLFILTHYICYTCVKQLTKCSRGQKKSPEFCTLMIWLDPVSQAKSYFARLIKKEAVQLCNNLTLKIVFCCTFCTSEGNLRKFTDFVIHSLNTKAKMLITVQLVVRLISWVIQYPDRLGYS